MDAKLDVRLIERDDFHRYIDDLAHLRIAVFREWPYLYDGDMAYERQYLRVYLKAERACIAGAFAGDEIVGVSTAMPLVDHDDAFAKPLADAGYDTETIFYFAESVLLPRYRGFGAGRRFFNLREEAARRQNFSKAVFSAVIRADDAPQKPETYIPLDRFWQRIGFQKLENIETNFSWKDIGSDQETYKPMAFWMKNLV